MGTMECVWGRRTDQRINLVLPDAPHAASSALCGALHPSFLNYHRIVELDSVQSFISVLLTALVNLAAGDSTSTVFSVQSAGTYYDQLSRSFPAQNYCLG